MKLPRWIKTRIRRKPQVYLLPTVEGLWWIGTIVLLMIMGWGYTNNLCLAMGMILLAMTVVMLMEAHFNLDKISIEALQINDQFAGQPTEVRFWWQSKKKRIRHNLVLAWDGDGPQGEAVTSLASDQGELKTQWTFSLRGHHKNNYVVLSSTFPLGLFKAWSYHQVPYEAWIYPAMKMGQAPSQGLGDEEGESSPQESYAGEEPGEMRRYQDGDSPNRIAWKVLARGLGVHTKTFMAQSQESFEYQWPWGAADEQSLSILSYTLEQHFHAHQLWSLKTNQQNFEKSLSAFHRQQCLRALAVSK